MQGTIERAEIGGYVVTVVGATVTTTRDGRVVECYCATFTAERVPGGMTAESAALAFAASVARDL